MHIIEWTEEPQKSYSNVKRISGRINGILCFEISQFKNEVFEDPYILSSKIFPAEMKKDTDLMNLKVQAWGIYKTFLEKIM